MKMVLNKNSRIIGGEKSMKERKEYQLKFRLTKRLYEKIITYCDKYDLSVSEVIRKALDDYLINK